MVHFLGNPCTCADKPALVCNLYAVGANRLPKASAWGRLANRCNKGITVLATVYLFALYTPAVAVNVYLYAFWLECTAGREISKIYPQLPSPGELEPPAEFFSLHAPYRTIVVCIASVTMQIFVKTLTGACCLRWLRGANAFRGHLS